MNKAHLYIFTGTLCLALLASLAGCIASMPMPSLSGLKISCVNVPGGDECEVM